MDLSQLAAGQTVIETTFKAVVDLVSDDDAGETEVRPAEALATEAAPEEDDEDDNDYESGTDASGEVWETDSLFEDALEEIGDAELHEGGDDVCTLEEAREYRRLLRDSGPRVFCETTVEAGAVTAKKLITAFSIKPPAFLEGAPDMAYYSLLSMALSRELSKRSKLPTYNTIDDVVKLLDKCNNIIVLTGAGISTSLGIPDFRSKDVGLYAKLEHLGLSDPQEVFDIALFKEDPSIFYSVARDILPSTSRFTPTHAFIKLLQDKGKLLTNYSQNIDNIEGVAGVKPDKLIQCHGSFATASCTKCGAQVAGEAIFPDIRAGLIPRCKRCVQFLRAAAAPAAMKRKRSANGSTDAKKRKKAEYEDSSSSEGADDEYDLPEAGVMKPDITFFGEALPDTFHERLTKHDKDVVDLVIVIGTSLKVAPVSEVVPFLPPDIPQIYISREPVKHVNFDVDMLGDCDVVVAELCRRAGWKLEHEMIPEGQEVDVQLMEDFESRWKMVEVKKGEGKE
ncbi:hypothetical protein V494_06514 [Pseudogymnoascus sp. VKM F-4513 (FW-928)]|nr:hypothetical protein V494_06514 [Pseudogymnoascus sp. VKM F-4513 (FW-928)]